MAKAKKNKAVSKENKAISKAVKKVPAKESENVLGVMIRTAREASGISQDDLAKRLNTKRTAISRIENHGDDIKVSTLDKVAKALGKELKVKIV